MDVDYAGFLWVLLVIVGAVLVFALLKRQQAKRDAAEERAARLRRQELERRQKEDTGRRNALAQQQRALAQREREEKERRDREELARKAQLRQEQNVIHSPEPPYADLWGLRDDKRQMASEAALDRLTTLPQSEHAKLFPRPKDADVRCKVLSRREALGYLGNHGPLCYTDRIQFWTDLEMQINVFYYAHCIYKLDEETFIMTERDSTYSETSEWRRKETGRMKAS